MDPDEKACPLCGETIKAVALKCKHCGEFLNAAVLPAASVAAPSPTSPPAVAPAVKLEAGHVLDLLTNLVDKSLVVAEEREGEGATRYRLLETVRQYSLEKLAPEQDEGEYRRRHRDLFLALAEEARPNLQGPEQAGWFDVLEREHDNLRAALDWCPEDEDDEEEGEGAEAGLRLAGALWPFWATRGHLSEGRRRCAAALSHPGAQRRTRARADALTGAGTLARMQGDYAPARALLEQSLTIRRESGDQQGVAGSLNALGLVAFEQGDYASARALFEQSLALRREIGDERGVAASLSSLGLVAQEQGDPASARALFEECLAIDREMGDKQGMSASLTNLGDVASRQGDRAAARSLFEQSLAMDRELGDTQGVAQSLMNLGRVALDQGDYPSARALLEEALALQRELGDKRGMAISLDGLGRLAFKEGDHGASRSRLAEGLRLCRELGDRRNAAPALETFAALAGAQQQPERAARLYGASEALRGSVGVPLPPAEREAIDRDLAALHAALGEQAFEAAWSAGRATTWEQAVGHALEDETP